MEKLGDKVSELIAVLHSYLVGDLEGTARDLLLKSRAVPVSKWCHPKHELICDYSKGPPVCSHIVACLIPFHDFRSAISECATLGCDELVRPHNAR